MSSAQATSPYFLTTAARLGFAMFAPKLHSLRNSLSQSVFPLKLVLLKRYFWLLCAVEGGSVIEMQEAPVDVTWSSSESLCIAWKHGESYSIVDTKQH